MKSIRSLAMLAALAVGLSCLTACNTTGLAPADPAASTPATSHYKADLAAGYLTLKAVRSGVLLAAQTGKLDVAHVQAAQDQCHAIQVTLDLLRETGDTPTNQTTLSATVLAAQALTVLITASQGVQK